MEFTNNCLLQELEYTKKELEDTKKELKDSKKELEILKEKQITLFLVKPRFGWKMKMGLSIKQ